MGTHYVVGVDLGQASDPTAIAVIEAREVVEKAEDGTRSSPRLKLDVRHLERLPLRMSYVEQVAYVAALMRRPPLRPDGSEQMRPGVRSTLPRTSLVIDRTGVGRPVFDMFKVPRLKPAGITITSGDHETREPDGSGWRVAKLLLVSGLQAALHAGDLKVAADLTEAPVLVRELQDFRASITETGYARFGAREGAHDDLVLAVAIACWWAEQRTRNRVRVRTFHI